MAQDNAGQEKFTAVLIWETADGDKQTGLLRAMDLEQDQLSKKDGFLGMTIAASEDKKRVFVLGQWVSKDAFDAAVTNDGSTEQNRQTLEQWGVLREFLPCRTHAVITPKTSGGF